MRPALLVVVAVLATACGSSGSDDAGAPSPTEPTDGTAPAEPATEGGEPVRVLMPERAAPSAAPDLAGRAIAAFGWDIYSASAASTDADSNVVVSPISIATALGMLEPGANGEALDQLHALLRIEDPAAWHASMSSLEQSIEARVAELPGGGPDDDQDPGEFNANIANGAFVQPGYVFRADYLEAIGTDYGAVIEELDFFTDQAAAAERINEFIADATDDRITDLVSAADIDPATVLALVNALVLQASWQAEFDEAATADHDFHVPDGTAVSIPLMDGRSDRSGQGDGWVAASKELMGEVSFDVVLPDEGRFDEVADRIDAVFTEFDAATNPGGRLAMPRFETRVDVALKDVLLDVGLTAPFEAGNLLGIADDPRTVLDNALHQTWLSVDESGIEAAAATVLLMVAVSEPIEQPVEVVLDRPFLFRIVDGPSTATLFVGRVMDPTG